LQKSAESSYSASVAHSINGALRLAFRIEAVSARSREGALDEQPGFERGK